MRILILSTFFPPLNSIASHRPHSWAKYWSEAGHSVTVATTPKDKIEAKGFALIEVPLPDWIGSMKANYQQAIHEPPFWKKTLLTPYHYLRHQRGIFNACRMPDFTDFWVSPLVKRLALEQPWDWIVSTAGPYAVHTAAARLKKMGKGQAWCADFRDLWSANHAYPGVFPFTWVERWLEKKLLKQADLITTVSEPWARILGEKHGTGKTVVIENGFEPADLIDCAFKPSPSTEKFRVVHTGMLYPEKQAISLFFEALNAFPEKDKLECCFVGPQLEIIHALTAQFRLQGIVTTAGHVSRSEALALQQGADALLFFPWDHSKGSGGGLLSGKIYEYLYAHKPILAVSTGQQKEQAAEQLILSSHAGGVFRDCSSLVQILHKLVHGDLPFKATSPQFLEQFSRKTLALNLLSKLDRKTL